MTQRPRLVVGDDGSAAADVVWLWVTNHDWPGWRISVVTARKPEAVAPVGDQRAGLHPWQPPDPRRLLTAEGPVPVEYLLAEADPRMVLDSLWDADLIAIGPRGRGVLKHLHLGSTAEWLLSSHRPLSPIAVIRSARRTRTITVCVDAGEHSRQAVLELRALPWVAGCTVTVLGVEDGRSGAQEGIDHALDLLGDTGARLVPRLVSGVRGTLLYDAPAMILETIAEDRPDLVVMGCRGVGGVQRVLLGSTASEVAHQATGNVLVVRHRLAAAQVPAAGPRTVDAAEGPRPG